MNEKLETLVGRKIQLVLRYPNNLVITYANELVVLDPSTHHGTLYGIEGHGHSYAFTAETVDCVLFENWVCPAIEIDLSAS